MSTEKEKQLRQLLQKALQLLETEESKPIPPPIPLQSPRLRARALSQAFRRGS